jgi:tRNA(fMet)-specific endonuclease VapC
VFLFDSDVLITLNNRRESAELRRRIRATPRRRRFTSTINLAEMLHGAYGQASPDLMIRRIEQLAAGFRTLTFDIPAARAYAPIAFELRSLGVPIGEADTRIAAIAISKDLTVVTGNVRHFDRIPGLTVENWL